MQRCATWIPLQGRTFCASCWTSVTGQPSMLELSGIASAAKNLSLKSMSFLWVSHVQRLIKVGVQRPKQDLPDRWFQFLRPQPGPAKAVEPTSLPSPPFHTWFWEHPLMCRSVFPRELPGEPNLWQAGSHMDIPGRTSPCRRNSKCKGRWTPRLP